jgi:hypothetical protein
MTIQVKYADGHGWEDAPENGSLHRYAIAVREKPEFVPGYYKRGTYRYGSQSRANPEIAWFESQAGIDASAWRWSRVEVTDVE